MAQLPTISSGIPTNWVLPGFNFQITLGSPNAEGAINRTLIIGQTTSSSNATSVPQFATSVANVKSVYGYGSVISQMYSGYRLNDPTTETWIIPLADPTGTAATNIVSITGTATAYGSLPLYVGGSYVPVNVSAGDTAASIGANVVTAVNQIADIVAVATTDGSGTVTLTAKNVGIVGNFDTRFSYWGSQNGELIPTGVTVGVTYAAGVGAPTLAPVLSALPDKIFSTIIVPWSDNNSIIALDEALNTHTGRWNTTVQLFGQGAVGYDATSVGAALAWAQNFNSAFITALPIQNSIEPIYQVISKAFGFVQNSVSIDPGVPLQNVPLYFLAPATKDQWNSQTRNTLLNSGLSSFRIDNTDSVYAEKFVTFYTTNDQGEPDTTFRNVETLYTLSYVIQYIKSWLLGKFPRSKLLDDGRPVPAGSNFVTPSVVLGELIAAYASLYNAGYVDELTYFTQNAAAIRNGNAVNLFAPVQLVGQFEQINVNFSIIAG